MTGKARALLSAIPKRKRIGFLDRMSKEQKAFVVECVRMYLDGETAWIIQEIADAIEQETGLPCPRRRLSDYINTTKKERDAQNHGA